MELELPSSQSTTRYRMPGAALSGAHWHWEQEGQAAGRKAGAQGAQDKLEEHAVPWREWEQQGRTALRAQPAQAAPAPRGSVLNSRCQQHQQAPSCTTAPWQAPRAHRFQAGGELHSLALDR